jgi:hypothetical protein
VALGHQPNNKSEVLLWYQKKRKLNSTKREAKLKRETTENDDGELNTNPPTPCQ